MDPSASSVQVLLRELLGTRYEVREEIGDGGFGQVFEVFDRHLNTSVAAKVLRPELLGEEDGVERFLREIRLLCELRHPNIIPILDYFRSERLLAYLMPLIAGPTLRQHLDSSGALSLEKSLRLLSEIGGALDFAHRKGVFHRDLKPQNILLSDGHAVLADFGIARSVAGDDSRTLTQTGILVGSPRYMSPEQVGGVDRVDGRSDLYALATIVYEMLAGHPPFGAESGGSLQRYKMMAAPASLRIGRPAVPAALDEAILRGLAPNPADRQPSVGDFVRACEEAVHASGGSRAPSLADTATTGTSQPRSAAPRRVNRGLLVGAAALVIALGVFLGLNLLRRQPSAPEDALIETRRAWFVLQDVETTPADPNTAEAVRTILESEFEQSKGMGILTRDEVASVLRSAAKPESSVVRGALALEVAVRAQAKGMITASIRRTGDGVVIALRAIDVKRDSILISLGKTVQAGSPFLPQVEKIAAELRNALEPRAPSLASLKNVSTVESVVSTADFEAYQLVIKGNEAGKTGNDREAAFFFRQALDRDSTFESAWSALGIAQMNLSHRDSAATALEGALRHMGPSPSLRRRAYNEHLLFAVYGDQEARLEVTRRLVGQLPPQAQGSQAVLNNLANALSAVGRHREAIATNQRALRAPGANDEGLRANLTGFWLTIEEPDSAEATARAIMEPGLRDVCLLWVATHRGDAPEIDVLAHRILGRADADPPTRMTAQTALASRALNQGQVEEAWRVLDQANVDAQRASDSYLMNAAFWRQALMVLVYGTPSGPTAQAHDRSGSLDATISDGLRSLIGGSPARARAVAAELEQRFGGRPGMLEGSPALLRAWAASLEGNHEEVVRQGSAVLASAGPESYLTIRKPAARWLIARAFEGLGRPDSAAVHYRAALRRANMDVTEQVTAPLAELRVRQRLVITELRAGRPKVARAEREILARRVDRPDAIAAAGLAEVDLALGMSAGRGSGRGTGGN